jgi:hypothetical protein
MSDLNGSSGNSGAPELNLPNVCCGCLGEAQAALQLTGQFYESAGLMKYREIKRVVEVPICLACAAKEKNIQTARWIIAAACGVPFVILGIIFKSAITGAIEPHGRRRVPHSHLRLGLRARPYPGILLRIQA